MASSSRSAEARKKWHKDWSVAVQVSVERRGEVVLDDATAALLAAVAQTRSISAAARVLGISYRHAWMQIKKASIHAGQRLVSTATGGEQGGRTELTDYGQAALDVFQRVQQDVRAAAMKSLPQTLERLVETRPVVHLAAAISLQEALSQILSEYTLVRPTVTVRAHYGASNELALLIEQGSVCDLFVSASRDSIDQLVKKSLVRRGMRKVVARNGLAVVATADANVKLRTVAELAKVQELEIVVADPACPLGDFTKRLMQEAKIYDAVKTRLTTVDNSRAVVAGMKAGKPRVGIIFSSDLGNTANLKTLLLLPAKNVEARYEAAVIAGSQNNDEAKDLLRFLTSSAAEACFRRCGFVVGER
jgi:molybdate transport system substrate-binding protein